jgi:hypothetical protein
MCSRKSYTTVLGSMDLIVIIAIIATASTLSNVASASSELLFSETATSASSDLHSIVVPKTLVPLQPVASAADAAGEPDLNAFSDHRCMLRAHHILCYSCCFTGACVSPVTQGVNPLFSSRLCQSTNRCCKAGHRSCCCCCLETRPH